MRIRVEVEFEIKPTNCKTIKDYVEEAINNHPEMDESEVSSIEVVRIKDKEEEK